MDEAQEKETPKRARKRGWVKFIMPFLLVAFIVMQFFQPDKNNTDRFSENEIGAVVPVADTVEDLLKAACYDCHSNNTDYPWYTNIQPVGWWLKDHIDHGKHQLNFSEFAIIEPKNGKTTTQRQAKLLEEIREQIEENEMPLKSYRIVHSDARLSSAEKDMLINWADSSIRNLATAPEQKDN